MKRIDSQRTEYWIDDRNTKGQMVKMQFEKDTQSRAACVFEV